MHTVRIAPVKKALQTGLYIFFRTRAKPLLICCLKWLVMVRLFSINFAFQNKERLALVSIREKDLDLYCQVRYVDKQLNNLLCGKQFVFNLREGMPPSANASGEAMQSLMHSTIEAIEKHLNSDYRFLSAV